MARCARVGLGNGTAPAATESYELRGAARCACLELDDGAARLSRIRTERTARAKINRAVCSVGRAEQIARAKPRTIVDGGRFAETLAVKAGTAVWGGGFGSKNSQLAALLTKLFDLDGKA